MIECFQPGRRNIFKGHLRDRRTQHCTQERLESITALFSWGGVMRFHFLQGFRITHGSWSRVDLDSTLLIFFLQDK